MSPSIRQSYRTPTHGQIRYLPSEKCENAATHAMVACMDASLPCLSEVDVTRALYTGGYYDHLSGQGERRSVHVPMQRWQPPYDSPVMLDKMKIRCGNVPDTMDATRQRETGREGVSPRWASATGTRRGKRNLVVGEQEEQRIKWRGPHETTSSIISWVHQA